MYDNKIMMKISFVIEPDGDRYFGWSPDFSGVLVEGDTLDEAKENLKQAMLLHIETMMINDISLPKSVFVRHSEKKQGQIQTKKSQNLETEELMMAFA